MPALPGGAGREGCGVLGPFLVSLFRRHGGFGWMESLVVGVIQAGAPASLPAPPCQDRFHRGPETPPRRRPYNGRLAK